MKWFIAFEGFWLVRFPQNTFRVLLYEQISMGFKFTQCCSYLKLFDEKLLLFKDQIFGAYEHELQHISRVW
jgi:hypothetical protein